MHKPTARKLIDLNKRFYAQVGPSFDKTRQNPWTGWYELLPLFEKYQPLTLTDYGCGNGRFFQFLQDRGLKIDLAIGYDSDPGLLENGRQKQLVNAFFYEADLFRKLPESSNKPQITTAFGVLHHLPGRKNRLEFVRSLIERTSSPGLVVISLWRIPDKSSLTGIFPELTEHFEPGDMWLNWQGDTKHVRYCHAFSESEVEEMMDISAKTIGRFEADGRDGAANTYIYYRL